MVESLPANAGDIGLILGPGRFHMPRGSLVHAAQLLSPHPTAHAPQEKPAQ